MAQHSQSRQKSLLEQHAERQAAGGKAGSKSEKKSKGEEKSEKKSKGEEKSEKKEKDKGAKRPAAAAGSKEEWASSHPWKPWDRDKDLNASASKPKGAADLLKAAGSLSNRFSSGR